MGVEVYGEWAWGVWRGARGCMERGVWVYGECGRGGVWRVGEGVYGEWARGCMECGRGVYGEWA